MKARFQSEIRRIPGVGGKTEFVSRSIESKMKWQRVLLACYADFTFFEQMKTSRDEFPALTKRRLAERVGYLCSNPSCRKPTTGPHMDPDKSIRIGRAAHIHAASPTGPRYKEDQSSAERASAVNGIWLCANCADLIDKDTVKFPSILLTDWKNEAEANALEEMSSSTGRRLSDEARLKASKLIYEAFDLLAGADGAKRITAVPVSQADLEKVRRIIEELECIAPNIEKLGWLKGRFLLSKGAVQEAYNATNSTLHHDDPERLLIQAHCLYELKRTNEAIPLLQKVAENKDLRATALFNLGLAYEDVHEVEKAKFAYTEAVLLDPEYAYPHIRLAKIAYDAGDLDLAKSHALIATRLEPKDPVTIVRYSLILLDSGELNQAIQILQEALALFPNDSDVYCYLGRAYGQMSQYSTAQMYLLHSIALNPLNAVALYNLAMCHFMEGNLESCASYLNTAEIAGYPDTSQLHSFRLVIASLEGSDANNNDV